MGVVGEAALAGRQLRVQQEVVQPELAEPDAQRRSAQEHEPGAAEDRRALLDREGLRQPLRSGDGHGHRRRLERRNGQRHQVEPDQREQRYQQQPAVHGAALAGVEAARQHAEHGQKDPGRARAGERQDVQAERTRAHGVHHTQAAGGEQIGQRGQPERHVVGEVIGLRQIAPHPRFRGDGDVASQERVTAQVLGKADHAAGDQPGEQEPGEHGGDALQSQFPAQERREHHQRGRPQQVQGGQQALLIEREPAQQRSGAGAARQTRPAAAITRGIASLAAQAGKASSAISPSPTATVSARKLGIGGALNGTRKGNSHMSPTTNSAACRARRASETAAASGSR